MSSVGTPPQPYYPQIDKEIPAKITVHIQRIYPWLNNHESAILALNTKVEALKTASTTSTTNTVTTVTSATTTFPGLGTVNNQTGAVSYTTQTQDNGTMLIVDDASSIAVTLNSLVATPYLFFITNLGAGTATLTPTSGLIDGGASFTLLQNYTSMVVFDGTNWWASFLPVVPVNTPAVAHEWLDSYNATTGAFTQTQPAIADISGLAAALALLAPLASPALTGTPTAPTAAPLTNSTQIATTAYTDAAVGVETSRAETAEGLLAPKASPTFTGTVTQSTPPVLTGATTATSATAGAGSALPATPALYVEISINGVIYKLAAFNV